MRLGVLIWTPRDLEVVAGQLATRHPLIVPADKRYWFALDGRSPGRLHLRSPSLASAYLVSDDHGRTLVAPPPLPAEAGSISPHAWKLHGAPARLTALGADVAWILGPDKVWLPRHLPGDLNVTDVSFDPQGGLWCVGAAPSTRIPGEQTEAAARYQSGPSTRFEAVSPRLSAGDGVRVIRHGGLASLRTVDAEGSPVVATSLCSWFIEDESSFVFLLGEGATAVRRLAGETVRMVDRSMPGCVRVFTCQAGLWQVKARSFEHRSLLPALGRALAAPDRSLIIRGMDAEGSRLALVVEVARAGRASTADDPELTAICTSEDHGESFEVVRRQPFRDGAEILDVCWIR